MDEPYTGLDHSSVDILNETINNHLKLGGMVILSSHIKPEIRDLEYLNLENNAHI
jgi:ABC-type transport system involved in cytochrome c biogenesis ATPase subunit